MVNVFAVPVFFVCFRECLETSIIVSVLLSMLKQTLDPVNDPKAYKRLRKQVWVGVALGCLICLIIGAGMIGAFYALDQNTYAITEDAWEGAFALLASIIITIMGAVLLRVSKLQEKWRKKLIRALEATDHGKTWSKGTFKRWAEKYVMFFLPFVTVLREGLEAVVFVGGVGVGSPATAFPIPLITGLAAGAFIGFLIYKGGNFASMQIFLIVSTCFLYLIAAGLFSRGVWYLETYQWSKVIGGDSDDIGSGAGSYDIRQSVWHINCCNPELAGGGGWGVFNALFGWQNSATYGSVISYNLYWLAVMIGFVLLRFKEKHGHWPFMSKPTTSPYESKEERAMEDSSSEDRSGSESEKPVQMTETTKA